MISEDIVKDVQKINNLSLKVNGDKKGSDDYTLNSMIEHANEIKELFEKNNSHWAIETGDLMIHCMRILIANDYDLNEMFQKCKMRFLNKLSGKLKE